MARVSRHTEFGELLSAYLDGELQPGELEVVAAHLGGGCEECILEFREMKEARASIRLLVELKMPESLADEILHLGPELSAYLDGELLAAEMPAVLAHVESCARCRAELVELDAARAAIRALPGLEPPEFLPVRRAARSDQLHRRWPAVSAAAGVAAALALTLGLTTSSTPTQTVDLDLLSDRHVARASVESGFSILPAVAPVGEAP